MYEQDTQVSAFSLDISADGTRIASSMKGEEEIQLHIWDAIVGCSISRLGGPGDFPPDTCIVFLPDSPELLSWSENGILHRWNSVTGNLIQAYKLPFESPVTISVSRHASVLGIKDLDEGEIWTYEDGILTPMEALIPWKEYGENGCILDQAFLLDNHRVLFILNAHPLGPGFSTLVSVWDSKTGREIKEISFPDYARVAAICKERKRMAIVSTELPMQIWDIESATLLAEVDDYTFVGTHAAFSPTEMTVASIDNHGAL
ncbi:hypothetical protein FRC00_001933, partial [Tulasnella sp. 408]